MLFIAQVNITAIFWVRREPVWTSSLLNSAQRQGDGSKLNDQRHVTHVGQQQMQCEERLHEQSHSNWRSTANSTQLNEMQSKFQHMVNVNKQMSRTSDNVNNEAIRDTAGSSVKYIGANMWVNMDGVREHKRSAIHKVQQTSKGSQSSECSTLWWVIAQYMKLLNRAARAVQNSCGVIAKCVCGRLSN